MDRIRKRVRLTNDIPSGASWSRTFWHANADVRRQVTEVARTRDLPHPQALKCGAAHWGYRYSAEAPVTARAGKPKAEAHSESRPLPAGKNCVLEQLSAYNCGRELQDLFASPQL
jgi:hypothetical protein